MMYFTPASFADSTSSYLTVSVGASLSVDEHFFGAPNGEPETLDLYHLTSKSL
jgi:plastocyanin domain-containing protein